jgi:ubiquinone biosynthesis monooxygenase Coq7
MQLDILLRTLFAQNTAATRPSPGDCLPPDPLNETERKHSAGLMRINHTGEVCAQALYQGQAITARLDSVRLEMNAAAIEEEDHLAWCQKRLDELHARPSMLNPLWYGLSFCLGAFAGAIDDKLSLGFVAATEDRVCQHLDTHLNALPLADLRSRAIVQQMRNDEAKHGAEALRAGGVAFPEPVKFFMGKVAKIMTKTSYRI